MKRKSTDEGRSLEAYTYLGGDAKASLPHGDKVRIVHALRPDVGILVLNSLPGECLDAVMWILPGPAGQCRAGPLAAHLAGGVRAPPEALAEHG